MCIWPLIYVLLGLACDVLFMDSLKNRQGALRVLAAMEQQESEEEPHFVWALVHKDVELFFIVGSPDNNKILLVFSTENSAEKFTENNSLDSIWFPKKINPNGIPIGVLLADENTHVEFKD